MTKISRHWVLILCALSAPVAAEEADPVEPPPDTIVATPAHGPGASIDAVCTAIPTDDPEDPPSCSTAKLRKVKLEAPYDQLGLVVSDDDSTAEALLAIRMGEQWYLAPLSSWSVADADHGDVSIKSIKLGDAIPGGAPEILLTGTLDELGEGHTSTHGATFQMLWVCSVGASGAPSCAAVPLAMAYVPHEYGEGRYFKFKLGHKFDKSGRITRKLKGKWPSRRVQGDMQIERADYVNTRTLQFP